MENTKCVGEKSEAMVLARFLQLGWIVWQPFGDNQRYDLVIDRGLGFETVQVKTATFKKGSIVFRTCSTYAHRGRKSRSYKGNCDLFAVYSPRFNEVYLIKVNEVGETMCALRVEETKNKQSKEIRFASLYKI